MKNLFKNLTMDQLEELCLAWGTYGKNQEYRPRVKLVPLTWCETSHLEAILKTQDQLIIEYEHYIKRILELRGKLTAGDVLILDLECLEKQKSIPAILHNKNTQFEEAMDLLVLKNTKDKNLPLLINRPWVSDFSKEKYKERVSNAQ